MVGHREIERERLGKLIHEWLDLEHGRARFRDVVHQRQITPKIGELELHGRIDRLERTLDGAYVVIDYKTGGGAYSKKMWEVPRPDAPQLPIYAVAQLAEGHEIAGVAFAKVQAGRCKFDGAAIDQQILAKKASVRRDGEFTGMLESWQPELEKLAGELLSGHAEVDPKRGPELTKSTCTWCHLGALCRIAEFAPPREDDDEENGDDE